MNSEEHDEPLLEELVEQTSLDGSSIRYDEVIRLDARTTSSLNWSDKLQELKERKKQCLIHLDFGLFAELARPLADKTQFLSLSLAITHFIDTFYTPFQEEILGVILFAGDIIHPLPFESDESYREWLRELTLSYSADLLPHYAVDFRFEFLQLLANMLPRSLPLLVLIDASRLPTYALFCHTLLLGRKNGLTLGFTKAPFATKSAVFLEGPDDAFFIGYEEKKMTSIEDPAYGICISEADLVRTRELVNKHIAHLLAAGTRFKIITEEALTTEWMGLETLVTTPCAPGSMMHRKIQGFEAAQGKVIYL